MKKEKKKGSFLIRGGLLLLAAALLLMLYNIWDDYRAAASARDALGNLCEDIANHVKDDALIPDYRKYPEMEMPTEEVDGQSYIGVLSIPSINTELPVISRWSYEKLKIAPCRYAGSSYMDNLVIAAHNYTSHFGDLKELNVDDAVLFTDVVGNLFPYRVVEIETLLPADVEEMVSGDWDLTLFTCTIGGQSRIAVRCVKQAE